MSEGRLIRLTDAPRQRWRNGGGWTRELLVWPADNWQIRVSVAEIEADGAFSFFPGVRRAFAVLEGAGVELTIDGSRHRVRRDDAAVQFSGAAHTTCHLLAGATRDLNLMVRDRAAVMQRVDPVQPWSARTQSCGVFAIDSGSCRSDAATTHVPAYSLLWFEQSPSLLRFDAAGWWLAA